MPELTEKQVKAFEDLGVSVSSTEDVERLRDEIISFGETVFELLTNAFEKIQPAIGQLHQFFWEKYREAGMPYGETEEGMARFYSELGEANRLQREQDEILERQRLAADFRKYFAGKNER